MRANRAALAALALLAAAAATPSPDAAAAAPAWNNRAVAPPFKARTLDGATLDLAALLEKGPVLLDFWATWCRPCLASLPEIESLHRKHRDRGVTVIGISIDGPRNAAKVRPFAARLGLTYPIVLDEDGALQQKFRVVAVPSAILIARDGTIARIHRGYRPGSTAALEAALRELLPAGEPPATPAP